MSKTFKFIRGKTSDDYIIDSDKRSSAIIAAFDAGDSSEDLSLDTRNNKDFQDKVAALASEKKITIFTRKLDDINFNINPGKSDENTFTGITADVASVSRESDLGSTISEGCAEKLKAAAKELSYTASAEGNINWNIGTGNNETSITVKSGDHSKTMRAKFHAEGKISKRTYINASGINLTNVMNAVPQSVTEGSDEYASNYFSDGIKYEKAEAYEIEDAGALNVPTSNGSVRPALNYTVNSGYFLSTNGSSATNLVTTMNWDTAKNGAFYVYRKYNANGPFTGGAHTLTVSKVGDINGDYSVSFTFANTFEKGRTLSFTNPDHNFNTGSNNHVALKPSNDTTASYFGGSGWLSTSLTASKNIPAGTHVSFTLSSSYYGYRVTITATTLAKYSKVATLTIDAPLEDKVYPGIFVPEDGYIVSEDGVLEKATTESVSVGAECYKDPGDRQKAIHEKKLYVTNDTETKYYMWDDDATEEEISSDNVLVNENAFCPIRDDRTIVDFKELTLSAELVN